MDKDHYSVLGLNRKASKGEIKDAFKKLAMKHHPDKHVGSSQAVRDGATLRFKQVSEAYEVLMNDRKRADYDLGCRSGGEGPGGGGFYSGRNNSYNNYYYQDRSYTRRYENYAGGGGASSRFESLMRFMSTRAFLINAAFASFLLGATYVLDIGGDKLWQLQNSGKSFDDAMESIKKSNAQRDKG